jgi:hypothetical protein
MNTLLLKRAASVNESTWAFGPPMLMKILSTKWPPAVFLKKRGTDLSAVNQIANQKELEGARLSVPAFSERLLLPVLEVSGSVITPPPAGRCLYKGDFQPSSHGPCSPPMIMKTPFLRRQASSRAASVNERHRMPTCSDFQGSAHRPAAHQ